MNDSPTPGTLDHIAIEVGHIEEAVRFYTRVLNLKELPTQEDVKTQNIRWLDLGKGRALHLVESDTGTPALTAHFAISVDDIDAWRAHVDATGTEITPPKIDLTNAERFFIRDPSGNRIELVQWLDQHP